MHNTLLQYEILVTSTDTIPGILVNLTEKSFKKLNDTKKDRSGKPYLVVINSWKKISHFIEIETITPKIIQLLDHEWQSAMTFVFKARKELPAFLTSSEKTIALRRPNHEGLLSLLSSFDGLF